MSGDEFESFSSGYARGAAQILWRRVVADLDTPVGTYLKLAEGRDHTLLRGSVQGGTARGRYSMIGALPDLILKVENGRPSVNRRPHLDPEAFEDMQDAPLDVLRALIAETQCEVPTGLPSTAAGIYGYLGYDMV